MDWSHPNRRGYYEKNKAFIAQRRAPLRDMLTEDPIQVMFNGSVEPMRALVAALRSMPIADQFSVAITEYVRARLLAGRRQRRRLLERHHAGALGRAARLDRRPTSWRFGDNLNDVEMLDFAGTAYVMGNATEALKSRGYRVTASNDEAASRSQSAPV